DVFHVCFVGDFVGAELQHAVLQRAVCVVIRTDSAITGERGFLRLSYVRKSSQDLRTTGTKHAVVLACRVVGNFLSMFWRAGIRLSELQDCRFGLSVIHGLLTVCDCLSPFVSDVALLSGIFTGRTRHQTFSEVTSAATRSKPMKSPRKDIAPDGRT